MKVATWDGGFNNLIDQVVQVDISQFLLLLFPSINPICSQELSGIYTFGHSLHDYLITKLWFELETKTELINKPQNSASNKGVQFADMFSGLIQQSFKDNDQTLFRLLPRHRITIQSLFFSHNLDEPSQDRALQPIDEVIA